jgi:hypothetical protein
MCSVELPTSLESLGERCDVFQAIECPPFEEVMVAQISPVCGPLRAGVPAVNGPASSASSASGVSSASGGGGGDGGNGGNGSGGAGGGGGSGGSSDVPLIQCCYGVVQGLAGYGCGRPLVIASVAIVSAATARDDWGSPSWRTADQTALSATPERCAELALRWTRDAALEHASIASFARFVLDLLAVGAPAELVRGAEAAMRDEIDHAERCYALASRYAGRAVGPGPLPLSGVTAGGPLLDVAVRALAEGCIGETIAAVLATRALEAATESDARAVLAVVARDEAAHAELAFRFVAWAAQDEVVRAGLRAALGSALESARTADVGESSGDDAALEAHGQPGRTLRDRARHEALTDVIAPCLAALLAGDAN